MIMSEHEIVTGGSYDKNIKPEIKGKGISFSGRNLRDYLSCAMGILRYTIYMVF